MTYKIIHDKSVFVTFYPAVCIPGERITLTDETRNVISHLLGNCLHISDFYVLEVETGRAIRLEHFARHFGIKPCRKPVDLEYRERVVNEI